MPSAPCKWPTCTNYVPKRGDYCPDHADQGRQERRNRDRYYDQHLRDPDARRFYNSAAWHRARATKLATHPVCERCERVFAQHVHHRVPLKRCTAEQRLAQTNLMSVCQGCHSAIEAEVRGQA